MDINEIAKKMTREEFLNCIDEDGSLIYNHKNIECPSYIKGLKDCAETNSLRVQCYSCWAEAIKDIKFKDDLEKENIQNKEYTIQEVFNFPKGTKFKCTNIKDIVEIVEDNETKNKFLIIPKYKLICKLNDCWLKEKFILFNKEYMTFYEAKKLGTPKHKNPNIRYDYGKLSANDFVKEMNKKVWEVEE